LRTVHSPYGSNLDLSSLSPKVVAATIITAVLSNSDSAYAMPIGQKTKSKIPEMGYLVAWMCTLVYTSSRVPQLYKNYCRKSVDGISPLLFTFALLGNLTYSLSILTSTRMLLAKDKWAFLMDELPYILGSAGTIFFDLFYFGQRWYYGVEPRGYIRVDDVTEIESL
ncbi:DEKNAAC104488, partial [Brettanomyces naardenensis]